MPTVHRPTASLIGRYSCWPGETPNVLDRYGDRAVFRDVWPRPHPNQTWDGLWGPLLPRAYHINVDFLEYLAETERYGGRRAE